MSASEDQLPATDEWLTPAESLAAAGMRTTKRRTEYLLRRWVCKRAVAADAALPADLRSLSRIEVANHASGAPFLRLDGSPRDRSVSLSDRAGWAICVLGAGREPVGCDLELVEPRSPAFLADFLTYAERTFVASRPADQRAVAANLVWSAKESALKVLRTGLRRDTRSVEVHLDGPGDPRSPAASGWSPLRVLTTEGGELPGWWRRDGQFLVTVVTEEPSGTPRALDGSAALSSATPSHAWLDRPPAT